MEQDPQSAPEGTPDETGQGEVAESPETPPDEGQALQERMEKLERSYTEAQRVIGRQGRELGDLRKNTSASPQEENVPPDAFFTDPVSVMKRIISSELKRYDSTQQEQREADRYLTEFAEERGLTPRQLKAQMQRLQAADPEELLGLLADTIKAQDTSSAIREAAKSAKDTVTRNARAVTAESASTTPIDTGGVSPEEFATWPREKRQEYLVRKFGEKDY